MTGKSIWWVIVSILSVIFQTFALIGMRKASLRLKNVNAEYMLTDLGDGFVSIELKDVQEFLDENNLILIRHRDLESKKYCQISYTLMRRQNKFLMHKFNEGLFFPEICVYRKPPYKILKVLRTCTEIVTPISYLKTLSKKRRKWYDYFNPQ